MTDRRRNFFILLLVAGLLIGSAVVVVQKPTRLGLDLQGGVELVYQATPAPQEPELSQESIDRAIDVMRERVDQLGVSEPEIQRTGTDQISVALPDVDDQEEAVDQVGQVAQLAFYDWETNVIGPDGEPAPEDPEVHGGANAGAQGAIPLYEAVVRAKGREAQPDNNVSREGSVFYAVNREEREVYGAAEERAVADTREEALEQVPAAERGEATVYEVKEGTVIVRAEQPDTDSDRKTDLWYVLNDDVALEGTDIKNPEQQFDSGPGGSGQPIVTFDFTSEGRETWQVVTRNIAQRGVDNFLPGTDPRGAAQHFAIVLDNELVSVPFIDFQQNPDGIDGRNGSQIEGGFTIESAQELANVLRTGALPVQLEVISASQVSATLGQQALDQGLLAGIAGFVIVGVFLVTFYRVLGLIAVAALAIYALYFFALMKLIPVTLTLPGIAGLILTIGVAADANIVIFERVKEEIRAGRSIMAGIAAGYKKGLTAIIDANVVTVMVAFILFVLATAGVKGFALTLGLGVIVSMFTAVFATQAILGLMGKSRIIHAPSALGASKPKGTRLRVDYMGYSRWFFSASGVILLICAIAIGGKGIDFGIDFESGTRIGAALTQQVDESAVREVLAANGQADAEIQRVTSQAEDAEGPAPGSEFQISTETLPPDQVSTITTALEDEFGFARPPDTQSIGPTFGETVANSAVIAIIASLILIAAYLALRFEPKYAVPVLIAVMHDILITAGIYALLGLEVTTATVAALLTVLGFSLYDTIIVFDRIRENVPRMPRAAFTQIINRSLSEVIVRSLATSFCAGLPVLALLLFGGETLQDFAFALLIGTLSGTYSSVFIAGPVLSAWKERERVYRRRRVSIAAEHGGVVPAYAVAGSGADVDVEPTDRSRRRRERLTAPDDPQRGVSREEFDEMVAELDTDPQPRRTAIAEREADPAADASPEDVVMPGEERKPKREKPKKPRNRRHGRAR